MGSFNNQVAGAGYAMPSSAYGVNPKPTEPPVRPVVLPVSDDSFESKKPSPTEGVKSASPEDLKPLTWSKKASAFCEGFVSPLTDPFKSTKNFLMAAGVLVAHAVIIGATGGAAAAPMLAVAGAAALYHIGKGSYNIMSSKKPAEQQKAYYNFAAGISNMGMLALGAKTALKEGGGASPKFSTADIDKMSAHKALVENMKQVPGAIKESSTALRSGNAVENTKTFMGRQVTETSEKVQQTRQKVKDHLAKTQCVSSTVKLVLSDIVSGLSINSLLGLQ